MTTNKFFRLRQYDINDRIPYIKIITDYETAEHTKLEDRAVPLGTFTFPHDEEIVTIVKLKKVILEGCVCHASTCVC